MTLNIIFIISGLALGTMIWAKVWEDKHRKKPILLRLISLGDERVRTVSHELAHRYSEWKDQADFFLHKQLPLRTRNFINKTNTVIKEEAIKRIGDIRGSRFLKKSDGISEFFKSISDKETNGRIDESLDEDDDKLPG
ncbi:hypothetical protein KW796_01605 [Candidatus Parcubacteria bacterium]|nr:hypothetical protein [Candidatus Parcubacteria bacterium]